MRKSRQKRPSAWWILSVLLHLVFFGAVLSSDRFRAWLTTPHRPEMREPSQETLDRWVEHLKRIYRQRLRLGLLELRDSLNELNELEAERLAKLEAKFSGALMDTTPLKVRQAQRQRLAESLRMRDGRRFRQLSAGQVELLQLVDDRPSISAHTLESMDVVELHNLARAVELQAALSYERLRLYELSARQEMLLSRALDATHIAPPRRPAINESIVRGRVTQVRDGSFDALKRELRESHIAVMEMASHARRLVDMGKRIIDQQTVRVDVGEAERSVAGDFDPFLGKPYVGPELLRRDVFDPSLYGQPLRPRRLPEFGQKLMREGEQHDWLSINTWWIIGPFSHPGRDRPELLDKRYPPESVIDLGAAYLGLDGRLLKWRYRQTPYMRVEPYREDVVGYGIWYAYTEVFSDRDQTLWVAFGSDDYAVAWVNGRVVYRSTKLPHPWEPFEPSGLQPVTFRRGVNRVLVKLENAGGTTGFSMIVNTDEELDPLDLWRDQ